MYKVLHYEPRFITKTQVNYLSELWHTSRIALSGQKNTKYARMLWTAKEFHKKFPEITETAVYKDLDSMLAFTLYGGK